jgi:3-hydroxyisobutyrate dehydrogenase-like beta-hydroxyacid dehydrogenase
MEGKMKENQLFIDASTVDPETSQKINKLVAKKLCEM